MPSPLDQAMFLVSGPPASGKSTVARLIAERFARGVHVEGDFFRRSIVAGRRDPDPVGSLEADRQLMLRYQLAAEVADRYFGERFGVVLEDVIAGTLLSECAALVCSRPLHVVVLLPRVDVIAVRDSGREYSGYAVWSVQELHDLFRSRTPRLGLWIDSSDLTPEETVDEILHQIAAA